MSDQGQDHEFEFNLRGDVLGRLFMPRAASFEVLKASVVQPSFLVDSVEVDAGENRCRLLYSEWEEDGEEGPSWVSEYAIELEIDGVIAYGTYSVSLAPEQRDARYLLDGLRRDAEEDFMLCAKLLGRSVRRDLVIDDEAPARGGSSRLH